MKKVYHIVIPVLSILVILLLCLHIFVFHTNNIWVNSYFPNLITTIVGIIVAVVLVDRLLEREQNARNKKYQDVALKKLSKPIRDISMLFFNLIKASMNPETEHGSLPATYEELFSSPLIQELSMIDLSKKAPIVPQRTWHLWVTQSIEESFKTIQQIVDSYVVFLSPELVQDLHELETDTFMFMLKSSDFHFTYMVATFGRSPAPYPFMPFVSENYLPLCLDKVLKLIKHVQAVSPQIMTIDPNMYGNHVSPQQGESRI